MVNRNLLRQFDLADDLLRQELDAAFGDAAGEWLPADGQDFKDFKVVTGRVRKVNGEQVVVDVGYKSEGIVPLGEWYDDGLGQVVPPHPGDEVQVRLEAVEGED